MIDIDMPKTDDLSTEKEVWMGNDKNLYDIHMEFVEELAKRCEKVLAPKGDPMGRILGYVKGMKNPPAVFIYRNKDGDFELNYDHLRYRAYKIKWEDLGLCDSRCFYEWREEEAKEKNKGEIL